MWLERVAEVEVSMVQTQVKTPAFLFIVPSSLSFRNIEGKHISALKKKKNEAEV